MSFQNSSETEVSEVGGVEILTRSKSPFESFMLKTLAAPEWELRKFTKKILTRAGFQIFEDKYESDRCSKDPRYKGIGNLLAIRGEKPSICLVAHTDVCRDHEALRDSKWGGYSEYAHFMHGRHEDTEETSKQAPVKVEPVIKQWMDEKGKFQRIMQDRHCKTQVGGDDRVGCGINLWIAVNTGYNMGLLFPTDEESGLKSSRVNEIPQMKDFELCAQVDRGNNSDQLVIKISGELLCSYETAAKLSEIAYDGGAPRSITSGMHTDIYVLKNQGKIREAVNMTCGYHNSHGADPTEYIDLYELRSTLKYVADIVKHYNLKDEVPTEADTIPAELTA